LLHAFGARDVVGLRAGRDGAMDRARRRLAPVEVVRARGGEERDDVLGERLRDSVEDRHVGALGDVRDGRIIDGHPALDGGKGKARGDGQGAFRLAAMDGRAGGG